MPINALAVKNTSSDEMPNYAALYIAGQQAASGIRAQDNQNALAQMQIQDYQDNRGIKNSLNAAHAKAYESAARENDIEAQKKALELKNQALLEPAHYFNRLYDAELKSGRTMDEAIVNIQPVYEKYIQENGERLKAKGAQIPVKFDPVLIKSFLKEMEGQRRVSSGVGHIVNAEDGIYNIVDGVGKRVLNEEGNALRADRKPQRERQATEEERRLADYYSGKYGVEITDDDILVAKKNSNTGLIPQTLKQIIESMAIEKQSKSNLPPGAKDTGRTSGGKKVYALPDGKFYVQP